MIDNELFSKFKEQFVKTKNDYQSLNDTDIVDFFNNLAYNFFTKIQMAIYYELYKTITVTPEYNKKERNIPIKRITTKNNEVKLYIRDTFFFDKDKMVVLLNYELIFLFLKSKFKEIDASDAAFAIIWDMENNEYLKKWIYRIWIEMHPPYNLAPNQVLFLAGYVSVISKKKPGKYARLYFENYNRNYYNKLGKFFPFQVAIPALSDFSKTDIEILKSVIKLNSRKLKLLTKQTGYSIATISNSINRLSHTFILRQHVKFNFTELGWISVIGIITAKRNESSFMDNFNYPWRRIITVFRGTEDLIYCNFYIPNTHYAKESYYKWLKLAFEDDTSSIKVNYLSVPIFGIEKEENRILIQRPELYNKETESWEIGDSNYDFKYENKQSCNPINWDLRKRQIALEMIKKPYNKKQLYSIFRGNRSQLLRDIREIEESKTVEIEFIIPFFDDLIRALVIYDGNKYEEFIQKISYTIPFSINSVFEKSLDFNFSNVENLIGISFCSIPGFYLEKLHNKLLQIDRSAKIVLFPQNITSTPTYDPQPTNNGWKYIKLPKVSFVSK